MAALLMKQAKLQRAHDANLNNTVSALYGGEGQEAEAKAQGQEKADSSNGKPEQKQGAEAEGRQRARSPSPAASVATVPNGETLETLLASLAAEARSRMAAGNNQLQPPLTQNQRMCITYRASKKLVLWTWVHHVHKAWHGKERAGSVSSRDGEQAGASASTPIGRDSAAAVRSLGVGRRIGKGIAVPRLSSSPPPNPSS